MSMTQKRQLALCLRNTVVGMTLSFILWQAWRHGVQRTT